MVRRAWWFVILTAWCVGVGLRLWHLRTQILVDDEWHLVHRLRDGASLLSVVGDFGQNDHSIGLGAYGWLLKWLRPLDELALRMPSVVAGLVLLVGGPLLVVRWLDVATGGLYAWLLAVSPLLCFFSRLARPYAVTTLLVCLSVVSFAAWFASGGEDRRWRRAYLAGALLTPVFHLAATPAVFAPFAVLALPSAVFGPHPRPRFTASARLFGVAAASSACVLACPTLRSAGSVLARIGVDRVDWTTAHEALKLLVGSSDLLIVGVVGGASVAGAWALWNQQRIFTVCVAVAVVVQVAAVVVSRAAAIHVPIVAARYIAVVLPLLLLLPAAGIASVGRQAEGAARIAPYLIGVPLIAALYCRGPFPRVYLAPNDFANHGAFQADTSDGQYLERFRPYEVPAFYTALRHARAPGSTTIVEAPWFFYFHDFSYLQRLHHQHVLVGFVGDQLPPPLRMGEVSASDLGFKLARVAYLGDLADLRARGAEFVVLHRDLFAELRWPTGVTDVPVPMEPWIARYRAWCGAPTFEDRWIVVFAVAGCSSNRSTSGSGEP